MDLSGGSSKGQGWVLSQRQDSNWAEGQVRSRGLSWKARQRRAGTEPGVRSGTWPKIELGSCLDGTGIETQVSVGTGSGPGPGSEQSLSRETGQSLSGGRGGGQSNDDAGITARPGFGLSRGSGQGLSHSLNRGHWSGRDCIGSKQGRDGPGRA